MKNVYLERFCYSDMGTFGKLIFDDFECYTVERPWRDNIRRESCIPEGAYEIELGRYNKGGYPAYELVSVPDRSLIKIHIANTMDNVLGCIGVGEGLGFLKGKWAVTNSTKTHDKFMAAMDGEDGQIIVKSKQVYDWG